MPRFVLLEHRRDGVHFDFLLERGGVLRTWAIDEAIAPGRILRARGLPDHRLAYLDYEGALSGGRGTVRRLDRGSYVESEWTPELVRVRIVGDQICGEVELRRTGDAGATEWTFLVRGKFD